MKPQKLFEAHDGPHLVTERLDIRAAAIEDAQALAQFFLRNEEHFRPWDPPATAARFTTAYWQRQIKRSGEEWRADRTLRLHLFLREDLSRVIGRIGFSQIQRGPFQSCMLGYQIDQESEGHGLMFEALTEAIRYMFTRHGLHRIQANHVEENHRSAKLLAKLGFVREGLAQNYLFIAGSWRDHVLTALTNASFDASIYA